MGTKRNQADIDARILAMRAQSPPATYKEIALKLRVSERHIADVVKRGKKAAPPQEDGAGAPDAPAPEAAPESAPAAAEEASGHEGKRFRLNEPDPPRTAPRKPTSEPQEAAEKRAEEVKRVELRFW